MRVGVLMLPTDPWPETRRRAQHLEALGYDHLWTYDHLSWRRYRGRAWYSAIPWLTGIAGATDRIRLGTMVASPNLRHPVTLAQDAVTLDHVSSGRFVLGVGAGGLGFDSTVFGAETLAPGALVARLEEFVELLHRLFTQPAVSHAGAYFTVNDARIRPAAVQVPRIPIAIAAGGRRALALVARFGDAWITFGDTTGGDRTKSGTNAAVTRQARQLDDACAAIGRDPSTIRRVYLIGNTEERPLASTSAFDDFVGRYAALGFTDLVFHHPRPDDPAWDEPVSIVDDIATEVLPRWRS
jgi:alkanesulfonate monooxygenase SsuD/methylene tetrahydromethanopterin reductase-like flavin-dependent oxidoreductase (luciferase family)